MQNNKDAPYNDTSAFQNTARMAEDAVLTALETIWKANNVAEMREFLKKNKHTIETIAKTAAAVNGAALVDTTALPASVQRIGALLRQCAETGETYRHMFALLTPRIFHILRCYRKVCMHIAIERNGVAFAEITFSVMQMIVADNPNARDGLAQELKTWMNIAQSFGNENMLKRIHTFYDSLVPQACSLVQHISKRKLHDDHDVEVPCKPEPEHVLPEKQYVRAADFLVNVYKRSNNANCWISRQHIIAAVRAWGKTSGRAYRFTHSIDRAIYVAFPQINTKKEKKRMYFNLEARAA